LVSGQGGFGGSRVVLMGVLGLGVEAGGWTRWVWTRNLVAVDGGMVGISVEACTAV
jgi:hypothetical protein